MNLQGVSGIYAIMNNQNSKCYVGSATSIGKRFNIHKHHLRKNKHHSPYLQKSWNKHGEINFSFDVLENCPREELLSTEQKWIDFFKPEYNICKSAYSKLGVGHTEETKEKLRKHFTGHKHTEESKRKMSESRKGENASFYGKKLSPESIAKGIATQKKNYENGYVNAFKGKTHSEETKKHWSEIRSKKPIVQFDLNGNKIREWKSASEVEKELGFDRSAIIRVMKGIKPHAYKFKWKYLN